jgi:hypothetical protein
MEKNKIQNKQSFAVNKVIVHTTLWKWMTKNSVFLMTSWKRQVPRSTKWCLRNQNYDTRKNWKYLHNGKPRSREKTKTASARLFERRRVPPSGQFTPQVVGT